MIVLKSRQQDYYGKSYKKIILVLRPLRFQARLSFVRIISGLILAESEDHECKHNYEADFASISVR